MVVSILFTTFVASKPITEAVGPKCRARIHIYGKAFTKRLVFGYLESSKSYNPSKNKATVDAHWVCFIPLNLINIRNRSSIYIFGVGFWCCSFYGKGQCESLK